MSITLKWDQFEFSKASYSRSKGWENLERSCEVRGVTGTGPSRIVAAINAVLAVVPIGTTYPGLTNIPLIRLSPDFVKGETVMVRLTYGLESWSISLQTPVQIEVGGTVNQQQSNQNYQAADIIVGYTYPAVFPENPALQGALKETSVMVPKFVQEVPMQFVKRENAYPLANAKAFVGKMNNAVWYGGNAKEWLCTGIMGRSDDSGNTWVVTYSFSWRYDTWDEKAVYICSYTGKPPKDLVAGTGTKVVQLYSTANFGALGL